MMRSIRLGSIGAAVMAAFVLIPTTAEAQLTPDQAIAMMGRGINMGNTLEPPQEGGWNNPPAEEYYFDDYREAGFSTVRIPVRWDEHMPDEAPFEVDVEWMDRVEEVVDWALARDLVVVVNTHHEEWIKADYADATLRARFDSLWSQVATRFAGKPERLLFEIINEPKGMSREQVDDLNARVLGIIRRTNPTRIVIYGGNEWSNAAQLIAAAIPDDDYIIGYYHSYDPWQFAGLAERGWGSAADIAGLEANIQNMADWSNANGVPVIMSETGAIHDNDYNHRMKYYATWVEKSVEVGMPIQVWDDGGMFRVYDRENRRWPPVRDVLVGAYPDGPTALELSVRGDSGVLFRWRNRTAVASGISVQRARPGEEFETVAELPGSAEAYEDSDVDGGHTWEYRVISRNALGPDKYSYSQRFTVPALDRSNYSGAPFIVPGTIQAEDFDIGGEGTSYHDTDHRNVPGGYRPLSGVDIEARDDGGWHVSDVEPGEWLEYTIDVQTAGVYQITAHVASPGGYGRIKLNLNGEYSPTIRVPRTNSWQTTEGAATTMELTAGEQVMRASVLTANPFNLDRFEFTLVSGTDVQDGHPEPEGFNLYPNPTDDAVWLAGSQAGLTEVFDALGRRVLSVEKREGLARLDLTGLAVGVYWIQLRTEDTVIGRLLTLR